MSADNGIYILETEGPEYRIAHLTAIENVYQHVCSKHKTDRHFENDGRPYCKECHKGDCEMSECWIKNAREMWKGCRVYNNKQKALGAASKFYDHVLESFQILEYGISFIKIPEMF